MTHAKVYADDSQIIDLRIRMPPKQPPGKSLQPCGKSANSSVRGPVRPVREAAP